MEQIWLGTSWKMNKPLSQAMAFCETLAQRLPQVRHPKIQPFIIPPFTAIYPVSQYLQQHQIPCLTGAQNMHEAENGAWTGEISAAMLAETGASWSSLVTRSVAARSMNPTPPLTKKCIAPCVTAFDL